ncbi:MAG TPA: hypothetical protein VFH39_02415, partial [Candidatus Saccharimonadales bacterium]|nr:hypothetical protein [Candidatus Saccharimonadales bacterium]
GLRSKQGAPLSFTMYASDTAEHRLVAGMLKRQWRQVGVDCQTVFQSDDDLSSTVATHSYDALLYGISIGVDPDVYVYWDSSQTDPRSTRLNFSMYKSGTADTALEAGRTRQDPVLRAVKYKSFLQAWQQDAPAVGLYQPRFLYLTNEKVYGLDAVSINTDTDRFNNVVNWEVRTAKVTTH